MKLLAILFLFITTTMLGQSEEEIAFAKAKSFQEQLNATYANPDSTILSKKQLNTFKGLEFYDISKEYRVTANFKKTPAAKPFDMNLSSGRTREYVQYGVAIFELKHKELVLPIYQDTYYRDHPEVPYGNSLFLPFTDYTSGDGSYGGGRYIDLELGDVANGKVVLDFNLAYNPYCAYTTGYSCPIPPEANDIKVRVEAGVKDFKKEKQ